MSQIHVIFGSDEGTVSEQALGLFTKLKPEGGDDFSQETIDGVVGNAEDAYAVCGKVIESLQTLPFFGGGKTVWLKNANFLGSDRTSEAERAKEGTEALIACLEDGLPGDVHFLISSTAIHKGRRLYKFLNKVADVKTFDKPDISRDGWQEKIMPVVKTKARNLGLTLTGDALHLFIMLVGVDTRQIDNELEKLDIHLDDRREVTEDDVREIVPLSHAGVVFEIGNALQKKNAARAFELIDQQLARKESAIGILRASIIPTVRNLYMSAAASHGRSIPNGNYNQFSSALNKLPENERAWLPQKKDGGVNAYPLFLASQNAGAFGVQRLGEAMKACLDADKCLVSTALDHRTVLHRLIATICAA
ncbi:MAG: DNA polymerase III subunit delta [Akkermansiaceae bacterium]|nr:DNA polymerase III subunit delta [Akkermansiaceae bacterium]